MEWLNWFKDFENTKPVALVIFLACFCLILFYLYGSKDRGERLESYRNIPLDDDNQDAKGAK